MLTELDIINAMLASTGTAPLTANDTQHPFYIKASNKLELTNQEVQGPGRWFNKATRTLNPDVNGEVILPSNTLHCDPVDRRDNLVMRGTRLYDVNNATYTLDRSVTVYLVDLVPLEYLPPVAFEYIKARDVYEFYRDEDGNQPKLSEYKQARDEAWVGFKAEDLKNKDVNFFDGASAAQMRRGVRQSRLPLSSN